MYIICSIWEDIYCGTCSVCPDDPVRPRRPALTSDGSKSRHRFVTTQQHILKLPVCSFLSEKYVKVYISSFRDCVRLHLIILQAAC